MMYIKSTGLIVLVMLLFSCSLRTGDTAVQDVELPDMIQTNYEHYIYKNGRLYLQATIGEGRAYDKTKLTECIVISAEVFNSKNELVTRLSSERGEIDSEASTLTFLGNVVVEKLDKEASIHADEIVLNYRDNMMTSNKPVTITKTDGSILKADSMSSDLKNQKTDFTNMDLLYYYNDDEEDEK